MTLRISFELGDDDLKHFKLIMREARKATAHLAPEDVVAAAEELLASAASKRLPEFVVERIDNLRLMIRMVQDVDWRLPHPDAVRVLNALAYFAEPDDLIPDNMPGLGFLDDAIMIELVTRELRHEIEAYTDFCDFRDKMQTRNSHAPRIGREQWLDGRRKELLARMKRRRKEHTSSASVLRA